MAELEFENLSMDPAAQELIKKAQAEGVETIWDRAKAMKPCPIGIEGACCRICAQGPCRVPPPKKKAGETGEEKKQRMGLCGATAETIVARNFARMVAAGTGAHSDHARGVAKLFIEVANGRTQGYQIKDVAKLRRVAKDWDMAISEGEGDDAKPRPAVDIAKELGHKVLAEFGQQEGEINYVRRAPKKRQEIWRKHGVVPRGMRHRGGGTDAPHPHGRGPGLPQPHQAVHPLRPGGRLGRLHDLHRPPGHHVRLPHAGGRRDQPGRPQRGPRQLGDARP